MAETTIWDVKTQSGQSVWLGYSTGQDRNYRQYVENGSISADATAIKVRFHAHPTSASPITDAWIGPKKAAGDAYDYADVGDITRITFNTGDDNVEIAAGGTVDSDEIAFTIDKDTDYIIAMWLEADAPHGYLDSSGRNVQARLASAAADEGGTRNVAGYTEAVYSGPCELIISITGGVVGYPYHIFNQ